MLEGGEALAVEVSADDGDRQAQDPTGSPNPHHGRRTSSPPTPAGSLGTGGRRGSNSQATGARAPGSRHTDEGSGCHRHAQPSEFPWRRGHRRKGETPRGGVFHQGRFGSPNVRVDPDRQPGSVVFEAHEGQILTLARNAELLFSGSADGTIKVGKVGREERPDVLPCRALCTQGVHAWVYFTAAPGSRHKRWAHAGAPEHCRA
ncbi:unnamed protein product [Discosporangium mesarthrocarpum]